MPTFLYKNKLSIFAQVLDCSHSRGRVTGFQRDCSGIGLFSFKGSCYWVSAGLLRYWIVLIQGVVLLGFSGIAQVLDSSESSRYEIAALLLLPV
ncbi:UNVERIFIED_CONTAM: hypothetical protein FKN15_070067 [Acipenser sinensis]